MFFAAWARQATEKDNIRVNGGMVRNVLDALGPAGGVSHALPLVTGLKHYLGPFEAAHADGPPVRSRRFAKNRAPSPVSKNFYYEQEDPPFRGGESATALAGACTVRIRSSALLSAARRTWA